MRPGENHSQIMCGGCHVMLMYPQGASNVRCARCQHITAVPSLPTPPAGPDYAKVACSNIHCRVVLMYPRGAPQVQCSLCGTITNAQQANTVGHVVCGSCRVTLMYQYGASSVKCSLCHHVTQLGPARPPPGSGGAGPSAAPMPTATPPAATPPAPAPIPMQTVVVENPPTLDENGQEQQSIVVGVTTKTNGGKP